MLKQPIAFPVRLMGPAEDDKSDVFDAQYNHLTFGQLVQALNDAAPVQALTTFPELGGTYETQGGELVKMVGIHNAGTHMETLVDESGVNRYSRRSLDVGRVTGSPHDYSDSRNLRRPIVAHGLLRRVIPQQTSLLLNTLKDARDALYNGFEPNNQSSPWHKVDAVIKEHDHA